MKQLSESFIQDFSDTYGEVYGESASPEKSLLKEHEYVDVYVVHPDGKREFVYSRDDEGNRSKSRSPERYYVGDVEIPYEKYYGSEKGSAPEKKVVEIDFSDPRNPWKAVGNLYKCLKAGLGKGDLPEGVTKSEIVGAMAKNVAYLSGGRTFDILKAIQEVLPEKPRAFYSMNLVWDGDTVQYPSTFVIVEDLAEILGNDSIPAWISLFTTDPKEIGKALDAAQKAGREKYSKFGSDYDKNIWAGWIPSKSAEETLKDATSDKIIDYFLGSGIGFSESSKRKKMIAPKCPYSIYLDAVRFFMEKDPAKKNGILEEIRKKLSVGDSL